MGLELRDDGLVLHTRMTPKPGSDVAARDRIGTAGSARKLAFLEKDALFVSRRAVRRCRPR
jgi:hypothetical protein